MSQVTQIEIEIDFAEGAPPCCCGDPDPPPSECESGWCRWIVAANPAGSNSNKYWALSSTNQYPCVVAGTGECNCQTPLEDPNDYPEYAFGNFTCTDPITLIQIWLPP